MKKILIVAFFFYSWAAKADVIEIVSWKFKQGVSSQQATDSTKGLDKFLKSVQGFRSRSTYFDKKSMQWVDVVVWKDRASAESALKAAETHPAYQAFFPLVEEKSVNMGHYVRM